MDNEIQRIATITSLQEGKKIAMKDIEFYIEDLDQKANREVKDGKGWAAVTEEAFNEWYDSFCSALGQGAGK